MPFFIESHSLCLFRFPDEDLRSRNTPLPAATSFGWEFRAFPRQRTLSGKRRRGRRTKTDRRKCVPDAMWCQAQKQKDAQRVRRILHKANVEQKPFRRLET